MFKALFSFSAIKAGSAGMSDGNICSIQINNGRNICPQRRGYNIVAFDPYTGQTLSGHFDVFNKGNVTISLLIFIKTCQIWVKTFFVNLVSISLLVLLCCVIWISTNKSVLFFSLFKQVRRRVSLPSKNQMPN